MATTTKKPAGKKAPGRKATHRKAKAAPRYEVGSSPVHGRGLYAAIDLGADQPLLDYGGEIVDWEIAQARWEEADGDPDHTFFFDLGDGRVIDGGSGGNEARFINHGCDPNCEAVDDDGTIHIVTLRAIPAGAELFIDYRLSLDDDASDEAAAAYACRCGASSCRGTMLAR